MMMKKVYAVIAFIGLLLSCSLEVPIEISKEYSNIPEVVDLITTSNPYSLTDVISAMAPTKKPEKPD